MTKQPPYRILISDTIRVWGGAQRFILELAEGLTARAHHVAIQTFPGSPLSVRAKNKGLPVFEVASRMDAAPWTVLPLVARFRRRPYDFVITTFDKDLRTTGLAARIAGGAIVIHTRECDDPVKNKARYRWFYTKVADHIIVNSRATQKTTLDSVGWLAKDRTSILYKGIDLSEYDPPDPGGWEQELHKNGDRVVIGYAGQLVGRKRLDVVMRLLARDGMKDLPWTLAVAGTGPDERKLHELSRELSIHDRVIFSGFVSDIHRWMCAIDLFILPSFIEGFGYVLAEAGAAGKPSVAYRASSIPEVVVENETALLAAQGNDDEFAAHLKTLITDGGLRRQMGEAARKDTFARHGLDKMIDRTEEILGELAKKGRS